MKKKTVTVQADNINVSATFTDQRKFNRFVKATWDFITHSKIKKYKINITTWDEKRK